MFPVVGVWKLGVQSERIRGARAGRGKVCAAYSELGELGCLEVLRFGIPDVHGTAGKVVVEGVECERACIDAGTQPDFFTYPGDEHNMMGKDRVHLHERITQYFEYYLK